MFDLSRILSSRNSVERVAVEEKSPQKRSHEETEGKKTPRKSKMVRSAWNVAESSDASSLNSEEIDKSLLANRLTVRLLHSTQSLLLIIQSFVVYVASTPLVLS